MNHLRFEIGSHVIYALFNAFKEARAAFLQADDTGSKVKLAADFLLSRLLRASWCPQRNRSRVADIASMRINYRFNRGDLQSIREVLLEDCYRLPFPLEPLNILDLGANIGLTSLWMWKQFRPKRIIAVECDPENAGIVRLNFQANNLPGEVVEAAVGSRSGVAEFVPDKASNLGRLLTHVNPESRVPDTVKVPMAGMKELLSRFDGGRVDLVKVDIEGAEEAIFSGDLSWLQSVQALIVEMHEDRVDVPALTKRVIESGFRAFPANTSHQDNLIAFLKL